MTDNAQALFVLKDVIFHPSSLAAYEHLADWARQHGFPELATRASEASLLLDDLEADFNRMCIGPYRLTVPPYESVWRSQGRVLNNQYSAAVMYSYEQAGLGINPNFNELPDFIGNELEFIYTLFLIAEKSKAMGDDKAYQWHVDMANQFWAEHLGHWVANFLEAIEADTQTDFWAAWARTLELMLSRMFESVPLSYSMAGIQTSQPMTFFKKESL